MPEPTPAQIAYEAWIRSKEAPAMPETPTPGQLAYDAYWRSETGKVPFAWETLTRRAQQPWEAAAQAVLMRGQSSLVPASDPQIARLVALAEEARPFLEAAFGAVLRDIVVHVQSDASAGEHLLRVVARVASDDTAYLDGLLRYFDDTWWLANCHRAGGRLVFDYERLGPPPHPLPAGEGTAP